MVSNAQSLPGLEVGAFVIAPREICKFCHSFSGPRFVRTDLRASPNTNFNFTGPERALIESNVTYAQWEIAQVCNEISRLQRSIATLQRHRDSLQQFEEKEHIMPYLIWTILLDFLALFRALVIPAYIKAGAFVVAPREICESCNSFSGPKFVRSDLRVTIDIEHNTSCAFSEIIQVSNELSLLLRSMEALQRHREDLRLYEKKQHNLLSLIRKLPVELFQQILLDAQHEYYNDNTIGNWHAGQVAGQVSTYFRLVSHSYPSLWSSISVRVTHPNTAPGVRLFIEKCLRLSKETPLNIRSLPSYNSPLVQDTIRTLAQSAYRWETFTDDFGSLLVPTLFGNISSSMTCTTLQELKLTSLFGSINLHAAPALVYLEVQSLHIRTCKISLGSTPMLNHVHLNDVQFPSIVLSSLPWSQIQRLTAISSSRIHYILTTMSNLRFLELHSAMAMPIQHIWLAHLEELVLVGYRFSNPLDNFTTPSLRTLRLLLDDCPGISSSLIQLIRRSRCSLKQLTLGKLPITEDPELWTVAEFESIKHLTLVNVNLATCLQYITQIVALVIPSKSIAFPGLETLNIEDIYMSNQVEVPVDALILMLTSRLHLRSAVTRLRITFERKISDDRVNRLRQFMATAEAKFRQLEITMEHQGVDIRSQGIRKYTV